jgi:hemoglobin
MSQSDDLSAHATTSVYEALGGASALREAVERFYGRVLADPQLAPRFVGVDLTRLKCHQALLLSQALGGPQDYDGRSMAEAHAGMAITPDEYARVGSHLVDVLAELDAGADVIVAVRDTLVTVQPDIVAAGAPGRS